MTSYVKRTSEPPEPERKTRSIDVRKPRDIGDVVRVSRERHRLTQSELANECAIDRFYLGRLEAGTSTEYIVRLLRLMKELGITMTLTWET